MKKRGDDRKWLARVLAIGTECDVALLTGGCVVGVWVPPLVAGEGGWRGWAKAG